MKPFALKVLIFSIVASVLTCQAKGLNLSAESAILMDADSGEVLYEKDADTPRLIASTTKIMTALVAIEHGSLQKKVQVSAAAAGVEGSSMNLQAGERLTLETLLYGLLLCSGNDAAVAVAEGVAGSQERFVQWMNDKARQLGMNHSSFANPHGLDDEKQYSSARDMAVLAAAAMQNPTFARLVSTTRVTVGKRTMVNHNKLLTQYAGCIGLKTGYTRAAGRTLVSCAQQAGKRLVAVTLKDGNDWQDHRMLLDFGFAQ